ncbi:hypothetical protein M405DRAFT_916248 [Rhizopogon salebrosus TDB-379]|nr:hypothetical protein M405DRAFT_916248 [Rhizopogon salebrosus TDB-379]
MSLRPQIRNPNLYGLGDLAGDQSLTPRPASAAPSEQSTLTRPQSVVQGILGPFGETLTHESFSVAINEAIERVRAEYKEELRQLKLSLRIQDATIADIKEDNEILRRQDLERSNMRTVQTAGGTQSSSSLNIRKKPLAV